MLRKELLVQCVLLLAALGWLGSDAASTATVGQTTPSSYQKSVSSTTSVTIAATTGDASTQGNRATVPLTTPSTSTASAISNATAATAGAVSTQGSTATVSRTTSSASTTSAVSNATAGAVSTQGSTAMVSRTTPSASTTSAVSNATAATAGAVSTQGSTATVSRTTPSASTTSAVSNATAATAGAVSTQGSTAMVSRTTPSASTTSAVSNATAATAGAVSTQGNTATVSRTTPSASTTSAVSNATAGAVSTQGSTATVPLTTPSTSTASAISNATAALDLDAGCNEAVCSRPHCACASDKPPAGMRPDQVPQFVTLTFDDAVTVTNMAFYRELLEGFARKNKANGCGIAATFFVSHEYTDYAAVNALHSWGNEIAVHSISHRTDWDYWNTINSTQWEREMLDQKVMMETFANVPASDVTGVRGPFLYTGGDQLFRMQAQHFRYDCTLVHQRVRRGAENPVYPYTMDFGFRRSCMVYPCPERTYPGLWVVPMNVLFREREGQDLPCAMADMCVPQPVTANDTFEYLRWARKWMRQSKQDGWRVNE
nr:mucin-5AC-like isoform X1 [Dermacentor andersoni]